MTSPKKFLLLVMPVFIAAFAEAQTVKVKKDNARIKGETIEGFETELEGTSSEVSGAFVKFLKSYGKLKQADIITVNEPTISGILYTLPLFVAVKENSSKTASAWLGIKAADWHAEDAERVQKELEKIVYDFGVKYYRDKIQVQIDEAARAVQAVERQQQRLINESKNLNTKLEDNKREKIQLEKSLADNKVEHETLLKKIDQNVKAQDSVALATEQIKKAVEMHKERQRKVN